MPSPSVLLQDRLEQVTTFGASGYALAALQLFDGVEAASVAPLLDDCPVLRVAAGQPVLHLDHDRTQLYIVLRGALGAADNGASNDGDADAVPVRVLPGECVGELAVLDDGANPAAMVALEDSEVLAIDAARLWQLIDCANGVARNLLRMLSFRIRAANAQIRRRQKLGEFYRQLSMLDGLTGLQNRAWLDDHLGDLVAGSHAIGNPLAVVMIDLDHFKRFNDTHGHQAGDDALRIAARALTDGLRPRDFAVRYGGEELMVILPNTNRKAALLVAERLCARLRAAPVFADGRLPLPHITGSFGVAVLADGDDAQALVARADRALYGAKQSGRDRVVML